MVLGQEMSLNPDSDIQVGSHTALALRGGKWVKAEMVKLTEASDFADRRRSIFADSKPSGSGECPSLLDRLKPDASPKGAGKEDEEDGEIRTLWVDYDEHSERYKRWRDLCKEISCPVMEEKPLEGPLTTLHLAKHMEKHGGDPRLWLQMWCRTKHIDLRDRTYHELKVLRDVLYFAGTFDQLNLPALMSIETVSRRIQAIADAYTNPDKPSWANANVFAGQGALDDVVSRPSVSMQQRRTKRSWSCYRLVRRFASFVEHLWRLAVRRQRLELIACPRPKPPQSAKVAKEPTARQLMRDYEVGGGSQCPEPPHAEQSLGHTQLRPTGRALPKTRGRDLFPIPRFACPDEKLESSRSVRRRRLRLRRIYQDCNEVVDGLNWMAGCREEPSADRPVSLMHEEVLARVEGLVGDQEPRGALPTAEGALSALLHGSSPYDWKPSNETLASFQIDILSVPGDASMCPRLEEVAPEDCLEFLDEKSELMLKSENEVPPEAQLVSPYWDPKLKFNQKCYHQLVQRIHAAHLLNYTLQPKCMVGIFCVWKSNRTKLRMISDARRANQFFREPPGVSLMTGEAFGRFELEFDENTVVDDVVLSSLDIFSGLSDVKDCFHRLRVPMWLSRYFCWYPVPAKLVGLDGCELEGRVLGALDAVYPCYASLCQGFTWSLFFAQRVNEHQCNCCDPLADARLSNDKSGPVVFHIGQDGPFKSHYYVYVDNLGVIGQGHSRVSDIMDNLQRSFNERGLDLHASAVESGAVDTLGCVVECNKARCRINPDRLWKVRMAIRGLLRRGRCTGKALEIVVGHLTLCGLISPGSLSILHTCYAFIRKNYTEVSHLWLSVVEELRAFSGILFMMCQDWIRPLRWSCPQMPASVATECAAHGGLVRRSQPSDANLSELGSGDSQGTQPEKVLCKRLALSFTEDCG